MCVFRVETTDSWFKQMEPDHPVAWFTREQFLKWSPFAEFYVGMFEVVDQSEGVEVSVHVLDWDLDVPVNDQAMRAIEQL